MTASLGRPVAAHLDTTTVREDFPILRRLAHGHRLVYLDSAATSQKPRQVLDALRSYYENSNANVHRGVYLLAEEATELYEAARVRVARFIGASSAEEVIFTRNATEAINLVAYTWGQETIGSGDTIAVSALEHHSNFVPWQVLAANRSAQVDVVDLTSEGTLDLDCLDRMLMEKRVRLVAIAGISNVMGTINPLSDIVDLAHGHGAMVLVDAAQMAPHMTMDVRRLDADFVAFTGHKMLAPMGIGVLWAREQLLQSMPPFLFGGEMIRRVTERETTWNDLPWKFEAGTPNVEGAIGLASAIDYLEQIGMKQIRAHEKALVAYALHRLADIPGASILGPRDPALRGGVIAFTVGDIHPHDLASILDRRHGVCIRAGHHCAQPLHERLGLSASARASFYLYNDFEDVDVLCDAIQTAKAVMG